MKGDYEMKKAISLEAIERSSYEHDGWGAGAGATINFTYKCPCGKGKVFYEKEDTPGFRESSTYCNCPECNSKYDFIRNSAYEK